MIRKANTEVWATDTISADLPSMVDFKRKADQIILGRYGISVEHYCATRPVERESIQNYGVYCSSGTQTRQQHLNPTVIPWNTLIEDLKWKTRDY
jgi:hypothetical protein